MYIYIYIYIWERLRIGVPSTWLGYRSGGTPIGHQCFSVFQGGGLSGSTFGPGRGKCPRGALA